jgi:iron complex outermembrane receptor protein
MGQSTGVRRSLAAARRVARLIAMTAVVTSWAIVPSFAQTDQPKDQQTAQLELGQAGAAETIQVTGTRIRAPNVVAVAPVVSVSDEEVKLQGTTNVETLLNNLPQVTADQNNTISNGSSGTATVDLRGLGVNRTLVLIDGKRLGPGDASGGTGGAADLNFIPATLVSSVEVLTGGASTDYGSDALSGVVNFKMKRDFEGVELDQQFGAYQHDQQNSFVQGLLDADHVETPGNQLDGVNRTSTIIAGANGANGKSNITLYLTDAHTDPVLQASRDYADCETIGNGVKLFCAGSINSPQGVFIGNVHPVDGVLPTGPGSASFASGHEYTTNPNGTDTLLDTTVNGGQPLFNFTPINAILRNDQRYTAGGFAHYEIAPWADFYSDFGFLDDKTVEQLGPGGLFEGGGPTGTVLVNCNNPFLSAQEQTIFGCNDPKFVNAQNEVSILTPGVRFAGVPRTTTFDHTDYRFVVGARGDLPYGFNYDISASYFTDIYQAESGGFASFNKVQDALLVTTNAAGQPVCISGDAGCLPLNIFTRGAAVGAPENSAIENTLSFGQDKELVAGASVSGDLGRFGGKSPFATNPVSVVAGYEYRFEGETFLPDEPNQTGDLFGGPGPIPPIAGSFDDNDFYGEVHVPVLEDLPFAKAVDLDLGLRHSGYQVYGTDDTFDTNTWKFQGDWQIVSDIKLRGGYNRAARAPNTFELFEPQSVTIANTFNDPCSSGQGAVTAALIAACERTGLTAAQVGNIPNCPTAQCGELIGGNPQLKPEVGDTYTWGFVATPTMLPNFVFSMDYFTVDIANAIGVVAPSISLDECIAAPSPLCANIHRGPGGVLFGQTGFIVATNLNTARLATDGIDFSASYKHDLDFIGAGDWGSMAFNFFGTYTASLTQTPFPGAGSFDCAGLFGDTCGQPTSAWRNVLRTTWLTPWDANISLNWRHLSGVAFDGNTNNPLLEGAKFNTVTEDISSFDYFDLAATWQVRGNLELRAGINNIFDRDPPVVDSNIAGPGTFGNGNTYPGVYDPLGRQLFVGATMKF